MAKLPQYFTDSRTGGFSQAMDYAPVRISYMNCQDVDVVGGVRLESEFSNSSVVGTNTSTAVREMGLFGGQCKCKVTVGFGVSNGGFPPLLFGWFTATGLPLFHFVSASGYVTELQPNVSASRSLLPHELLQGKLPSNRRCGPFCEEAVLVRVSGGRRQNLHSQVTAVCSNCW